MPDLYELFDEYAARYARGERPRAREYLARAGPDADRLARLLDGFVAAAELPAPADEDVALVAALASGESPLLELRVRRGLKLDEVVDALVRVLGLDPRKREKVKRYYQQLETGVLEPRRVDRRVFAALAEALRARVEDLVPWRPRPLRRAAEASHAADLVAAMSAPAAAPPAAALVQPEEWEPPDEIDEIFGRAAGR